MNKSFIHGLSVLAISLLGWLAPADMAWGHALAPALLNVELHGVDLYSVTWKLPRTPIASGPLTPIFPDSCHAITDPQRHMDPVSVIFAWKIQCGRLAGETINIDGLANSTATALVRIQRDESGTTLKVLTASESSFRVPSIPTRWEAFIDYGALGLHHLLMGMDHILLIISLTLLVGIHRYLLVVVTSFTIGHSVTLSAAVLGYVSFPQKWAEALIALTLVITFGQLLAPERQTFSKKAIAILAGGIGLLHGLGFAGALRETGLPANDIPIALLGFNLGIEVGQLALVCLMIFAMQLSSRTACYKLIIKALEYSGGVLGGFWFWQRLIA